MINLTIYIPLSHHIFKDQDAANLKTFKNVSKSWHEIQQDTDKKVIIRRVPSLAEIEGYDWSKVTSLYIDSETIDGSITNVIKDILIRCVNLKELSLIFFNVNDGHLGEIQLSNLKKLFLVNLKKITNSGLENLRNLKLTSLVLKENPLITGCP